MQHKFLGLTFNEKLSWMDHIAVLKGDLLRRINILKIISNKNTGSDRQTLKKVYESLIQSKIDYSSPLYYNSKPKIIKPLDVIINSGLRIVSDAYRTSPIISIYCEAGQPTPSQRRDYKIMKYITKTLEKPDPILNSIIISATFFSLYQKK